MRTAHLITSLIIIWHSEMALATNWLLLVDVPPVQLEVDGDSIAAKRDLVEARFRFDHSKLQKSVAEGYYQSAEVTSLFNCKDGTYAPYRRIEFEGHNSTGKKISRIVREGSDISFYDPGPGSMGEIMFDHVCHKRIGTK